MQLTKNELETRIQNFYSVMEKQNPNWDTAIIINKVNQYYFTGTIQDGLLVMKRDGTVAYFARRSFERAKAESPLDCIYPMESYRDAVKIVGESCGNAFFELEVVPFAMLERIKKYFLTESVHSLDRTLLALRAVKSPYELYYMEKSGALHNELLTNIIPTLLKEGMSEADLVGQAYEKMVKIGFQGIARFAMFQTEMVVGQVGFGDSSIYSTNFDGPGGALGMSPATPFGGSRERTLKKGDLVFADIAFGVNGYHSDKTQVYLFGATPSEEITKAHNECIKIQSKCAELLKPGNIPMEIYNTVLADLSPEFTQNFMGFGDRQAKFLGHGVGLVIDEYPVIANGFKEPLQENMVIALEPKKGIKGIGMVGVEDTYVVTPNGGRCITGGGREIIIIRNEE